MAIYLSSSTNFYIIYRIFLFPLNSIFYVTGELEELRKIYKIYMWQIYCEDKIVLSKDAVLYIGSNFVL